jgi:hypothetical protein
MSGGVEDSDIPSGELTKKVMSDFSVDEKTAEKIIAFANSVAIEKMNKWIKNNKTKIEEKL